MAFSGPGSRAEPPAAPAPSPSEVRGEAYAQLMQALLAARRGEYGAALQRIERAVELEPRSADLLIEGARLLQWSGARKDAERLALRALELDASHHEALRFVAEEATARALASPDDAKLRSEALALLERLSAVDPAGDADDDVLRQLVQLRYQSDDLVGAISAARKMVDLRPGDAWASSTLAQLLLKQGEQEAALDVLLRYVAQHPLDLQRLAMAEQLARHLSAWEQVANGLAPGAPYADGGPEIQRLCGEALLRVGRPEAAVPLLERALAGDAGNATVREHLHLALRGSGRLADSVDVLQDLAREDPNSPYYAWWLGELYALQGDEERALRAYRAALFGFRDAQGPVERDAVRQEIADLLLAREDLVGARAMIEELEHPATVPALRGAARLAIRERDWDAADLAAGHLRDLGQSGAASLIEGEALLGQERWGRAEAKLGEAIAALGDGSRPYVAMLYLRAERPEQGLSLLREWVRLAPESADARFALARYVYETAGFAQAEPELAATLRLDPDHAEALNFLGYSLAENKTRLDEALRLIQRALTHDTWNGAFLDSLGWTYYQMGRFDEAREPLERAARERPADPTILEHLGDVYLALGQREEALRTWDRALSAKAADSAGLEAKIERERSILEASRSERREEAPAPIDPGPR